MATKKKTKKKKKKKGVPEHIEIPLTANAGSLFIAARYGEVKRFANLPDEFDINATDDEGYTVLHHAVKAGEAPMTQLLIELGCDIEMAASGGRRAIHFAAGGGTVHHVEVMDVLLQSGVSTQTTDAGGNTALHLVCRFAILNLIRMLAPVVDLDTQNSAGHTALRVAATHGFHTIAKFLLEEGADYSLKAKDGLSMFDAAVLGQHQLLVKTLLQSEGSTPQFVGSLHKSLRRGIWERDPEMAEILKITKLSEEEEALLLAEEDAAELEAAEAAAAS